MSSTKPCSCPRNRCLNGNCKCFRENVPCSKKCACTGCKNTKKNKAEVELRQELYLKGKSPGVAKPAGTPCGCRKSKCARGNCSCFGRGAGCTSKCKCDNCANPNGVKGSELRRKNKGSGKNTKPARQGSEESVNYVPREVVQTKVNRGSDSKKRPRNKL